MNLDLRYLGHSGIHNGALTFAPNLARPPVFFDGELREPLRFREAMSALHDVVVGDLKAKKKDRSAWEAWKAGQAREEVELRAKIRDRALVEAAERIGKTPPPPNLEGDFRKMHGIYWKARIQCANQLSRNDPALFRALVPCDPVVTVAPDVVFFECFAKDESAYGCLTVERSAFGESGPQRDGLGTTNVDYSLALYDHFQTLRTYRATRLLVDPAGFEVASDRGPSYREEKIDLPPSWLRGFGQLQAATALPATRVELSVDVVYSILAYLKRHREKTGPRSIRLILRPGQQPRLVLEPWNVEIVSRGAPYDGALEGEIKLWGRRRLMSLARLLPMTEKFDLMVFGSGLPSIWTAHMREMRFVLALSGWTANDWTRGSNLDQFFANFEAPPGMADSLARYLEVARSATLEELERQILMPRNQVLAGLQHLAKRGQLVYDFAASRYRWRPLMPVALSETLLGPDNPELEAARAIVKRADAKIVRDEPLDGGRRMLAAVANGVACEGIIDLDGAFKSAKCSCSFYFKNKLRAGPCRHLLALRTLATTSVVRPPPAAPSVETSVVLLKLPELVFLGLEQEAERRNVTLSAIVEQAWKIARPKISAAQELESLLGTSPDASAYRGGDKRAQLVPLSPAVESELQREAARLDVAVSRVVEAAFLLSRDALRLTSSLLFQS